MAKKVKTKNRNLLTLVLVLLAFGIGLLVAFLVSDKYLMYRVDFSLASTSRTLSVGSSYEDDDFVLKIGGKDYQDKVVVKYFTLDSKEVDAIDMSKEGSYLVKYILDYDGYYLETSQIVNVVLNLEDNFEVHVLMTGNKYTGDAIYIKAGENDILIDAGSKRSSAKTIRDYLDGVDGTTHSYVTDNKLEYVISTHAHEDHIAAFVGSEGIFQNYEIETLIDFPLSNSKSKVYKDYREEVLTLESKGTKHYSALDCFNNENGGARTYELGESLSMEILYNPYYEEKASGENDYSTCVLFKAGDDKYLFTGDLESDGESALVDFYAGSSKLQNLYFYKASHHGSNTSSSPKLLEVIRPEVVVVPCVAFSDQYTSNLDNMFPAKKTINNYFKYGVKHLYVTQMASDNSEGYLPANGNVVLKKINGVKTIECSQENRDFYDTEAFPIFAKYRSWQ